MSFLRRVPRFVASARANLAIAEKNTFAFSEILVVEV